MMTEDFPNSLRKSDVANFVPRKKSDNLSKCILSNFKENWECLKHYFPYREDVISSLKYLESSILGEKAVDDK